MPATLVPALEASAAASASSAAAEADGVWDIEREPPGLSADSCSYYSQAQLSRLIRSTWAAQTQPLNSFVCGTWPSLKKALVGQYAGMPLDPSTGKPYAFFGMRAPLSAFRVYGDDAYYYAVHVHEGAIVATLMALIAAVPMMINLLDEHTRRDVIFYSQTSLFAGCPLSWLHVVCDGLYTLLVTAYCVRWQRQLLVNEANPEQAVQSASEVRASRLGVTKSGAWPHPHARRSIGNRCPPHTLLPSSRPERCAPSQVVEACSVVVMDRAVRDWSGGEAARDLAAMERVAGSPPIAMTQARESMKFFALRRRLNRLELKRPWLVALERAMALERETQERAWSARRTAQLGGGCAKPHESSTASTASTAGIGAGALGSSLGSSLGGGGSSSTELASHLPQMLDIRMPTTFYGRLRLRLCELLDCGEPSTLVECDEEVRAAAAAE